jgi:hypothetical protein
LHFAVVDEDFAIGHFHRRFFGQLAIVLIVNAQFFVNDFDFGGATFNYVMRVEWPIVIERLFFGMATRLDYNLMSPDYGFFPTQKQFAQLLTNAVVVFSLKFVMNFYWLSRHVVMICHRLLGDFVVNFRRLVLLVTLPDHRDEQTHPQQNDCQHWSLNSTKHLQSPVQDIRANGQKRLSEIRSAAFA